MNFTPRCEGCVPAPVILPKLNADRDQLIRFIGRVFRHAEGRVSLRAFTNRDQTPVFLEDAELSDQSLVERARAIATKAANDERGVVFSPPIATFNGARDPERGYLKADQKNLKQGLTLSVELDKNPSASRRKLEALLGPATLVIASGGRTDEGEDKLHCHWVLTEPTATEEEHGLLTEARRLACSLVGADGSGTAIVHPYRWPGGWHTKRWPRPVRIVSESNGEIELDTALTKLRAAAPRRDRGQRQPPSDGPEPSLGFDRRAIKAINDTAMANFSAWVPDLFPAAVERDGSWRITSAALGRNLEEDISITPEGIMDFGLHDIGDPRRGKRTPIELVQGWLYPDIGQAAEYLRSKLGVNITASDSEPVDLWGKFDPPPLPEGLLPETIEAFATEQGELMGADPAALAAASLAVCAAAIPDSVMLNPKRHDPNWAESPRIWLALVGGPSTMKTPILHEASRPLVKLDVAMHHANVDARIEYDALPAEERRLAAKPTQRRLRIEDTTIEAAQEILKDSPEGVLCLRDELSGWFGAMDKYSGNRAAAADRGFWLQAYNGGSYAYNRVNRGGGLIENLSVSILGGIQPEPMRKVAEGSVDDGLMQRVIMIMVRPAAIGSDEPRAQASASYNRLIVRLNEIEPPFDNLRLDDGAMTIRKQLEKKHLDLMACEAINRKLAAHIGKYNGLFARLCVIWHCVENAHACRLRSELDKDYLPILITEQTAERVAKFMHEFLLPHALAFYSGVLGLSDDHDRLTAVAGYILARGLDKITNRDVQRGDRTMRNLDRRDTDSVFNQLDALGWLIRVPGTRPTDPPHWRVNPEVHRRFAQRAKQEAERRREERAVIANLTRARGSAP
jgi:hypothetical protein